MAGCMVNSWQPERGCVALVASLEREAFTECYFEIVRQVIRLQFAQSLFRTSFELNH